MSIAFSDDKACLLAQSQLEQSLLKQEISKAFSTKKVKAIIFLRKILMCQMPKWTTMIFFSKQLEKVYGDFSTDTTEIDLFQVLSYLADHKSKRIKGRFRTKATADKHSKMVNVFNSIDYGLRIASKATEISHDFGVKTIEFVRAFEDCLYTLPQNYSSILPLGRSFIVSFNSPENYKLVIDRVFLSQHAFSPLTYLEGAKGVGAMWLRESEKLSRAVRVWKDENSLVVLPIAWDEVAQAIKRSSGSRFERRRIMISDQPKIISRDFELVSLLDKEINAIRKFTKLRVSPNPYAIPASSSTFSSNTAKKKGSLRKQFRFPAPVPAATGDFQ